MWVWVWVCVGVCVGEYLERAKTEKTHTHTHTHTDTHTHTHTLTCGWICKCRNIATHPCFLYVLCNDFKSMLFSRSNTAHLNKCKACVRCHVCVCSLPGVSPKTRCMVKRSQGG